MAAGCCRRYSCETATQTLEWINAINDFLIPYKPLLNSHVVNFFTDRLWESVDKQWIDCLRHESVENLLQIPSGVIQDNWPSSLKEFVLTSTSLVFPREQGNLQMTLPDLHVTSLSSVLAQGMNLKKKHEVEILAAVITSIAKNAGAQTIIDVGAGQGYLAQVLSFQYQLSVVAIDASSHHGTVTSARAKRIMKHYAAKMRERRTGNQHLNVPQTITCRVLSSDVLKALSGTLSPTDDVEQSNRVEVDSQKPSLQVLEADIGKLSSSSNKPKTESSLVLAGLHACGDLSVTMLRLTFVECEEVKAIVSIGCCYNLLSEEHTENTPQCGFPMSDGVNLAGLSLGKNARDLACQSAERWRSLSKVAAVQNFELHAFRAAFQMVLNKYYPEVLTRSPSIGRQGKALRRQQLMRSIQTHLHVKDNGKTCSTCDVDTSHDISSNYSSRGGDSQSPDQYSLFEKFCKSGLGRLGLIPMQEIDFLGLWMEAKPFSELVGPYWSLRAALGPLVETLLLLDRLLFLQEQGNSVEAAMLPLFDPTLSPRNVALIAQKI
ncbi:Methyltransferase domain [Macleaya cordata]|uniref:Methyltransferase domain n=1 Tax=Macleaya cordata TaxID=56857 RepID=A0A200QA82_MACCD|nr:Methyltransferase domain [Macleaya cordata]